MSTEEQPPLKPLKRELVLDMACPCGAKFYLEYSVGNGAINDLITVAKSWLDKHAHPKTQAVSK